MIRDEYKQCRSRLFLRWGYVFLGFFIMICMGTVYSWSIFRHHVVRLYQVGVFESGLPYMTALAFYALSMFLSGRYLSKYKPRVILLIGASLIALGWIFSSFASNIYILAITYGCLSGAGVGMIYGIPLTVVAKWFPEKTGLVTGIVLAGFGLSPLVTVPLASHFIDYYGMEKTFLIFGISFGGVISLCSLALKYPIDEKDAIINAESSTANNANNLDSADMIKSTKFVGLYINFVIGTMIGLTFIGMTSNIGIEYIYMSPKDIALQMSLFAIFNAIGRPVFGWLTDKFSSSKAMIISYAMIILAAFLMVIAQNGNVILFTIAFCLFWFNLGGWLAIAPTSTLAMYGPKHYNQNYGLVFTAYGVGAIIGVLASGVLLDVLQQYQPIYLIVIFLCAIGIKLTQITFNK